MSNKEVKYYKNPVRDNDIPDIRKPYIPNYKIMKINPEIQQQTTLPGNVLVARNNSSDLDNPRTRKLSIRQPYTDSCHNNQIPNVGNNMEQTWSYIDGEMVDDISGEVVGTLDNSPMIDNNDFIEEVKSQDENKKTFMTENDLIKEVLNEDNDLSALKDDSYILIIGGSIISVGDLNSIQEEASSLVFGEHPLCDGKAVPIEDVVVLKKVKIKVGLFLE